MIPYYADESVTLYHGEALAVLASLPTGSVDAVVADPPYSSGGMMRGDRAQATVAKYVVWGSHGAMPQDWTAPTLPGFFEASAPKQREHITQKPLDVMRQLVRIVPPGGVILDPFIGSGTTGVAAVLEGRRFVGVEQVEHFAEVALTRIREASGQAVARGSQPALDFGGEAS